MNGFDTPERRQLRELAHDFTQKEIVPHLAAWEEAGEVPRALHEKAAETGLLGIGFPEKVGGSGGDLCDTVVVTEEIIRAGGSSGLVAALFTHGIALPHIVASGDQDLIDRYARPTLAGHTIGALAITEPDAGSDVAALRTVGRPEGDHYLVNGAKTYITSGVRADFVTTAVRTGGQRRRSRSSERSESGSWRQTSHRREGLSLLVIDKGTPGFTVGRRLDKLGWRCSDTAELSFVDVRVPAAHVIGAPDTGFAQIMRHFTAERISLAVQAYATAQRCLDLSIDWCRTRATFGRPIGARQVVRHRLAEMATKIDVARTYVRHTAERVAAGELLVTEVAMAKNVAVAACDWVVDQAVQLHGGFGCLRDAEVERHYRDARILGIGGGTTEIMNEIIAKTVGI